ncbi:MAG: DUF3152 domain-containing protein [Micrococcales bacterium]|nr:DUF3152 domain-containing protein [Micrococcales bacterium]
MPEPTRGGRHGRDRSDLVELLSERTADWRARAAQSAQEARRRAAQGAREARDRAATGAHEARHRAAQGTQQARERLTPGSEESRPTRAARRRGPSREVRLRRTVVGATALALGVSGIAMAVTHDDPGSTPRSAASTAATSAATASPTARASAARPAITPALGPVSPTRPVVAKGTGAFAVLAAKAPAPATRGRTVTYTVEAEGGLGLDTAEFAAAVPQILGHPSGWQRKDSLRLVYLSPAQAKSRRPDLRVTLTSPATTDRLCAPLSTKGAVSCFNNGRAVINTRRWMEGADAYGQNLARYRVYLISHEVGHGLGHGHAGCPAKGRRAPVMLQQTLGLQGCTAWPYPIGA